MTAYNPVNWRGLEGIRHASDSEENAKREFGIVHVGENNFKRVVEETYGKL